MRGREEDGERMGQQERQLKANGKQKKRADAIKKAVKLDTASSNE